MSTKKFTLDVERLSYKIGDRSVRFGGGIEVLRSSIRGTEQMIEDHEDRLEQLKAEFAAMKELERRASK